MCKKSKRYCRPCDKYVSASNWARHVAAKHRNNPPDYEEYNEFYSPYKIYTCAVLSLILLLMWLLSIAYGSQLLFSWVAPYIPIKVVWGA